MPFGDGAEQVDNLYARLGGTGDNFCFAGHMDVVPEGNAAHWTTSPFGGAVADGHLLGRGAADMKGAIAAFVAAAAAFAGQAGAAHCSVSLLITGDEEGPAINGSRRLVDWLRDKGEALDAALVGEPTSARRLGDTIKIGRRGSVNCRLRVRGAQGHVAYPERADNPLPGLVARLSRLLGAEIDRGNDYFGPSGLALTSIDVGNRAHNVTPAEGTAKFNIRFNNDHTGDDIIAWLHDRLSAVDGPYDLEAIVTGEAFLSPPGRLTGALEGAIKDVCSIAPVYNTTGGTSDARFIRELCPVAELGLVGTSMHKVDESAPLDDIRRLADIYLGTLRRYFGA